MKLRKAYTIFFILALSFMGLYSVFSPSSQAQVVNTGGNSIPNPLGTNTFEGLIQGIARWFYIIMVPVASIMVLYAGFLFMTSGGDEEKIKKAKKAITYAVVGVAIILIGAGFITLIKSLLSVNSTT